MSKEYKKIFIIKDYDKVKISEEYIELEQFYLSFYPRIRCRKLNDVYSLTVKIKVADSEKIEFARNITEKEYNELKEQRVSKLVNKQRHDISFGNEIGIYDDFYGNFDLKIVSLEFINSDEMSKFKTPDFLKEVGDLLTVEDMKERKQFNKPLFYK